jgi:hypothetical protein
MANQDSETTIYGGLYQVLFKNNSHRYFIDGEPKPGVTTIMSKVIAKPQLMLWPLDMAMRYLTSLLPGHITTNDLEEAQKAHLKRRDAGGQTGTIVHGYAEDLLSGRPFSLADESEEVVRAMEAFRSWHDSVKPRVIEVERVVYSRAFDYAGTLDSILEIDGKVYLCDLKTSNASREAPNGVYADNFIQLGAYLGAYEEERSFELDTLGKTDLVEIDDLMVISCRKDGKLNTCTASELNLSPSDCIDLWYSTFRLHKGLSRLKTQLAGASA